MRPEIKRLTLLGRLPAETEGPSQRLEQIDAIFRGLKKPVTDDEARALAILFGEDDCFGLAWSLLHLVESAPGWPLQDVLTGKDSTWITELRERAQRGGIL
jgi:hypothetical protein